MADVHCALVVEDNPRTAADLGQILRTIACEPMFAGSREEALTLLGSHPPCVVLLDLQIPRTKRGLKGEASVGISLLEDIRRLFGGRLRRETWIPVIIISAHAGETEDVVELMKLDADDFIQKPYDADDVAQKVRHALAQSGRGTHQECKTPAVPERVPHEIQIPGKGQKHRTIVRIGVKEAKLRDGSLTTLLRLLIARARNASVPLMEFGGVRKDREAAYKAIDRLREDLANVVEAPTQFVINSQGSYALADYVSIGSVNTDWLLSLGNQTIAQLARELGTVRHSAQGGAQTS